MGKRQHQKDKMYLTYTEWSELYGGKKFESAENEHIKFKRLPYDHCCITMIPFKIPYCDGDGNVFELQAVVDFLKMFKINPITGKTQDAKNLFALKFHKNSDGEYHCPALFKPFTKNSHIVAVCTTGNVFSWEAVEQLNIKTKNWKDLVDDSSFQRKDLITIQDPQHLEKFDISKFYHIKKNLRVLTEDEIADKVMGSKGRIKSMNLETKETLAQLERDYQPAEEEAAVEKKLCDKFNAAHYSTGTVAASFTSTAMVPVSNHEAAIIDEDTVKYERVKKKGYVRITTNFGPLNFEIYCDSVPKSSENFIRQCSAEYYDGTKFHRSIRNFMIQGGDPTGNGTGGTSIWNKKFDDEFRPNLSHTGRGILSMANSGPNTNSSQFFITYRSCRHLDGKHTIFGKLVGGMDTLNEMEKIEVDNKDRPIDDIIIQKAQVFVDPFQEAEEELVRERAEEAAKQVRTVNEVAKMKRMNQKLKVFRDGIGKYLDINSLKEEMTKGPNAPSTSLGSASKKRKESSSQFGNFGSW